VHPSFVTRLMQRAQDDGTLARALRPQLDAALASRGESIEDAIAAEGRHQAAEQAAMAGLISSLRLVSTFDWREFFETVSLVEQVLQRDPAGVYARMDFGTRDRYRHAVEELAEPSGEAQAARRADERRARAAGRRTNARRARRARGPSPDWRRAARVRA
jgi:cyclic beta-1,2-glucan synthetase